MLIWMFVKFLSETPLNFLLSWTLHLLIKFSFHVFWCEHKKVLNLIQNSCEHVRHFILFKFKIFHAATRFCPFYISVLVFMPFEGVLKFNLTIAVMFLNPFFHFLSLSRKRRKDDRYHVSKNQISDTRQVKKMKK